MTSDVRFSKTLSYWLRHAPATGGLVLDGAGWAAVPAVLAALAEAGLPAGPGDLDAIAAGSDKNRFERSADGSRIRARQGHSVAVEGDWAAADPPALLYHGTVAAALPAIMAEGLKPGRRHHVHLSADLATATRVGGRRGEPVVLEVAAGAMAAAGEPFFRSGNGVWLVAHVPPAALRRLGEDS